MLIILGGLPGTGKTTIARELARQLGAEHLRIDSIEQAIRESGIRVVSLDAPGIVSRTRSPRTTSASIAWSLRIP